jgi:hypothetical protein
MSWAAIAAAVIGAGASAGIAAASAPDIHTPNLGASSRKQVLADLMTLPGRRALENAARAGAEVDFPTGRMAPVVLTKDGREVVLPGGNPDNYDFGSGVTRVLRWQPETKHADFRGKGDADVQSELARQMAELELASQQKYGVDYATEARHQEELADPLGFAARKTLHDELAKRDEALGKAGHPVADELDAQVLGDLQRGRGISPDAQKLVDDIMARRGGAGGGVTANVTGSLEQGPQAEQRLARAQQHALGFLSSGATPEDVDYRRRQQSLADMGNFISGRTPEAQFGALSGAQQGSTPQFRAPALPGPDPNAAALGQQGALTNYSQQVRNATTQVGDWFTGLSTAIRGAGAVVAANRPR